VLSQAEATRELAVLYGHMGRNQETLKLLNTAHRLFGRLNARRDLVDVAAKMAHLEGIYLEVVMQWGSSIESSDTYTFGHSGRVAEYAIAIARAFGLAESDVTAVRVGAYLHDVGKIRVPHEILNKPGRLSVEEFDVIKQHPVYGVELLASVDFPWDVKPIVRWHHEKIDGTGYPDGLRGDEIPLSAQIIGIADVYDALTTARSYRAALPRTQALAELEQCRHWWWPEVYEAFMRSVGAGE
jgi:putative nucleotidyltransferase with HDIG domain